MANVGHGITDRTRTGSNYHFRHEIAVAEETRLAQTTKISVYNTWNSEDDLYLISSHFYQHKTENKTRKNLKNYYYNWEGYLSKVAQTNKEMIH